MFILTTTGIFPGCVDDELIIDNGNTSKPDIEDIEGDAIAFTVSLSRDLKTRGETSQENYDNYIDTKDKFRVLFFTEKGDFLFGATDRTVTELSSTGEECNWYVRVPLNHLEDRHGDVYPVDEIKAYLKEGNTFKVAILANWPNQDVNGDENNDHPEPDWKVENSYYYQGLKNKNPKLKNINDLHHLYNDTYYNEYIEPDKNSGRPSRYAVYDFMMYEYSKDKNITGINTDWVEMRSPEKFYDKLSAESWIKSNWNPEDDKVGKNIYGDYHNLWYLWDFKASCLSHDKDRKWVQDTWLTGHYEDIPANYDYYKETWPDQGNNWCSEWFNRNGRTIKGWLDQYNGTNLTQSKDLVYNADGTIREDNRIDGLTFVPTTSSSCKVYKNGDNIGILLQPAEELYHNKTDNTDYIHPTKDTPSRGYLKFIAPATGTLRIKYGIPTGASPKLKVQRSTTIDKTYSTGNNSKGRPNGLTTGASPHDIIVANADGTNQFFRDISITGNSEPIYIWCIDGEIIIYAIEWICCKYLYDTDRQGKLPSEQNPIPMYGVQEFSIPTTGNVWENGTTYDISAPKVENGKTTYISLIRSLAKVIVNLPQRPSYIYFRSMNRKARVEPMDVESSTAGLWKDHTTKECEWFTIQKYGPGFQNAPEEKDEDDGNGNSKRMKDLDNYTNWLSWFYGSWQEASWYPKDNPDDDYSSWSFKNHNKFFYSSEEVDPTNTTLYKGNVSGYPHLFNPDIDRSDFCHFISCGIVNGYHRYILYVPEKNISDPNYPGVSMSIAKLPSIEYRYEGYGNDLDDNNCHRIYFTDYDGKTTGTVNEEITKVYADKYESEYEKNLDNLKLHWPIMRNHEYVFNVEGTGTFNQAIRVEVADWGYKTVNVDW